VTTPVGNCPRATRQFFAFWARPRSSRAISGNNIGNSKETKSPISHLKILQLALRQLLPGGTQPTRTVFWFWMATCPQYIQDNTDDEFSHANFLLAYLKSKGANTADLDLLAGPHFRTLPGSMATGSTKKGRLTNLTQLTIDTSFWGRYRTDNANPDLDLNVKFSEPVPSLNVGRIRQSQNGC
jgi:hypothetical protein